MKRWPLNKANFWETAPFFRLLIPLIAGIALYPYISAPVQAVLIASGIGLLTYIITAVIKSGNTLRLVHFALLHMVVFISAWLLCYFNDIRNNKNWFGNQLKADAFAAIITKAPAEKEKTWKLETSIIHCFDRYGARYANGAAFIYVFKNTSAINLREGDTILLPNKWQMIKNAGNPFEFDYAGYCARNNLYYQQFLAPDDITVFGRASAESQSWIRQSHNWCMAQLRKYIHDKGTLGLMQAMLIGDEANLDAELREAYSVTGIIHVIAISGSHIAFFFFIITFLLGWIRNKKYHWLKYALAVPLIWMYVLIAGAPPSAVRAAIMFSILGVGFALQKKPNSLNQLFAAAFLLLLAQPMWLYSIGFQLSFIAVLSLIIFYNPIYTVVKPENVVLKTLWSAVSTSLAAEILVAPLVIYYFHLFPLVFIIANVAAFIFMGVVLVLGMLIVILGFVPAIAGGLASITVWIVQYFNWLIFALQEFNPESFHFINLKSLELVLIYITISGLAVFIFKQTKPALFTALASCCVLLVSISYHQWYANNQKQLVVYNINSVNHIELITGKYFSVVRTDSTLPVRKKNYTLHSAHTGWYAWRNNNKAGNNEIIKIGRQSVLVLDQLPPGPAFPVDYVIVNFKPRKGELETIYGVLKPQKIILGSHVSRRQSEKWKKLCDSMHIPLHTTQLDGSFILPGM